MPRRSDPPDPSFQKDLHGCTPDAALRRVAQALHEARVRGESRVRLITGRGWGNREQKPILRKKVEAWLDSPEGRRAGARRWQVAAKGGALDVELG